MLSNLAKNSPNSGIRLMFELASKYENVINLCIGEPSFETPQNIVRKGAEALQKGHTKYTSNAGILELRLALENKLRRENGLEADAKSNIIVTTGAGEAILLSLLATVNPGDEVIVADPYWPNYVGHLAIAGAKLVPARVYEEDNFCLTTDAIERVFTSKTKALILNSPSNPTGAVLSKEQLTSIADFCLQKNIMIISDETYEKILFDGLTHFSVGSLTRFRNHVITIGSFSKTYAMTGWRVGYAQGPEKIIKSMVKIQENVSSCVNASAQVACVEALEGPQESVEEMVADYQRKRDLLVLGLNSIPGISCNKPKGAFYVFPNIKELGKSSQELAHLLVEKTQVITTPGSAFGQGGEGYLRFSCVQSYEKIQQAIERIDHALSKNLV